MAGTSHATDTRIHGRRNRGEDTWPRYRRRSRRATVRTRAARAFAFLAGTGAFLHGAKLGDRRALGRYLAVRGAILVLLELTVLREAWTFNTDFANYNLAGVIWMLGWCMILMAGLVQLPAR